jgi:hypothetical protein
MIKFTALLPRHPSMTHEEFVRYHRGVHAPEATLSLKLVGIF